MFQFAKVMGSTFTDDEIKADVDEVYELEKSLAAVG